MHLTGEQIEKEDIRTLWRRTLLCGHYHNSKLNKKKKKKNMLGNKIQKLVFEQWMGLGSMYYLALLYVFHYII